MAPREKSMGCRKEEHGVGLVDGRGTITRTLGQPQRVLGLPKGRWGPPSMVKMAKMTNIFFRCYEASLQEGLSVHPSVCPSIHLSVRPSVRPSVRLSVSPSVHRPVMPSLMKEFWSTLCRVSGLVFKSLNSCS